MHLGVLRNMMYEYFLFLFQEPIEFDRKDFHFSVINLKKNYKRKEKFQELGNVIGLQKQQHHVNV